MSTSRALVVRAIGISLVGVMFIELAACQKASYSFSQFTFPATASPDGSEWQYLGQITARDEPGVEPTESTLKKLEVSIKDRTNNQLLHDSFVVVGGAFDYDIEWPERDSLRISVLGVAPPSGEPLVVREYTFNGSAFARVLREP